MDEQVFLQHAWVLVTTTRIEVNGQTFAVRNVGSVRVEMEPRSNWGLVFGCSLGRWGCR